MTAPTPAGPSRAQAAQQGGAAGGAPQMPTGFFYPRWILLAGMLFMPAALIGFALHFYFSFHPCLLGMAQALCEMDVWPGWAQLIAMLGGFMILLFIAATYGRTLGPESSYSNVEGMGALVLQLTEFQRVRLFSWAVAALVTLGLLIEFARGQSDAVTLALGAIVLFACVRAASYRPRRPAQAQEGRLTGDPQQDAQASHQRQLGAQSRFWNVARNTPPFSYFFRTRHQQ